MVGEDGDASGDDQKSPVGALGLASLQVATHGGTGSDTDYAAADASLASVEGQRDQLVAQMLAILDGAAVGASPSATRELRHWRREVSSSSAAWRPRRAVPATPIEHSNQSEPHSQRAFSVVSGGCSGFSPVRARRARPTRMHGPPAAT